MFRDPWSLLWLAPAALAALAAHWLAAQRRARLTASFGRVETLARLLPAEREPRRAAKARLRAAALCLIVAALAGPQWGVELVPTEAKTHQVVIALDASLSMTAEDVKPNRLEKAKETLALLLDALKGQRVGVVAFAGEAAQVCPLTTDSAAARQILHGLSTDLITAPGTAIGSALRTAVAALRPYSGPKWVVLLSDGEDHKTDPLGAADEAAAAGVTVFTIGIGSPEGEPIPLRDGSGNLAGYKKDKAGKTVISKLGESTLSEIAAKTGGAYHRASPAGDEAAEIARRILEGAAGEAVAGKSQRYLNRFQWPLGVAFLLLLAELLIPETKRAAAAAAAALLLSLGTPAAAATAEGKLREGNRRYEKGRYGEALQSYAESGRRRSKDPRPLFNAGAALYRLDERERAAAAFAAVANSSAPAAARAAAEYNLGNLSYESQDYAGAVSHLRRAVALDPSDPDARHNLAIALRRQKDPPKSSKDQKAPPKPKDGGGSKSPQQGAVPPPPSGGARTKPGELSKEDAERILRAVAEREKAPAQVAPKPGSRRPASEEDW